MLFHITQFLRRLFVAITMAGCCLRAGPVINEFMAANTATLLDQDAAYSDWIEIYNPDSVAIDLGGWFLTDSATNKTKWQFPAVSLPAHGYLVVFASGKDRRSGELHTNFALSAGGEYLGLVMPDGVTVVSDFGTTYPTQPDDVSYGLVTAAGTTTAAFLSTPTPGAANSGAGLAEMVAFSRTSGPFRTAFSLQLSGAGVGQEIRYVVTPAASGANAPEPTASSSLYTGPIPISGSAVVRAAVFASNGRAKGRTRTGYFPHLGDSITTFRSDLPVMIADSLGTGPLGKDNVDHASWLYVYPGRGSNVAVFNGAPETITPMTMTVRGSSSAEFPKKGYNLKLTDEINRSQPQALLGLPAFDKWALVAPWSFDQSFINNSVMYSLSNQLGRWAPRTQLVELFANADGGDIDSSDYAGIYVLTDRIEVAKERVNISPLSPSDVSGSALTGGYIFKIDQPEDGDISWTTNRGVPGYARSQIVLISPKPDEIAPQQINYLRDYVQRMENALASDRDSGWSQRTYLDYIDRDAWVDHHILNVFSANPDAFVRSAYFTKSRNGKIAAGPLWDFDRALGSYWDERSYRPDVWSGLGTPDPWRTGWWGMIAQDPEFIQDWIDRWFALRRSELSGANLRAVAESFSSQIGAAAIAREWARWPDNVSPWGSYAAQIDHLKGWLTQRAEWLDRQFLAPPAVQQIENTLAFTAPADAQLIYTLDGSDPRSLGGDIAPNAIVASAPVVVPATSNIHVRSYNAKLRDVFPSSPWSAPVGSDTSSPLTPRARLVNISSRATVGTGENALIAGIVVADTESKRYLSRAIGPALAEFGAAGIVPDPQLSIFNNSRVEIYRNNGWETGIDAAQLPAYSKSVGAFPLANGSRDSALASPLPAGAYTVQITTPTNQGGVGLAELYELDTNGRTVNLSTRARVRTGDGVLIGGFVVSGPAHKRMLIRAVGPTLSAFGVAGALADPIVTIYSGQTVVASNDRWDSAANGSIVAAASRSAGAFGLAANSEDAALVITLPPGAYTVEVKGKGGTEGVALLEIYDLP